MASERIMNTSNSTKHNNIAAIVIGRNEGERLKRCIASVAQCALIVYVDSGSTDGSAEWAESHRATVVQLDPARPFTAARARNAGLAKVRLESPHIEFAQLIDGDCDMSSSWPEQAVSFLSTHPACALVAGRLRERYPNR